MKILKQKSADADIQGSELRADFKMDIKRCFLRAGFIG